MNGSFAVDVRRSKHAYGCPSPLFSNFGDIKVFRLKTVMKDDVDQNAVPAEAS